MIYTCTFVHVDVIMVTILLIKKLGIGLKV